MPHPLEQKIAEVRSRARRLLALYALGWTAAALLAAVLALGLTDYAIRFQDRGIRLMASLAVMLVLAWACYRFWYRGFGRRLGDVELAQRVERRFPNLANRLTSAVQFLKQPESDVHAGSAALRRAVILETASASEKVNFSEACEPRPTRQALAAAAGLGLIALVLLLAAPGAARTGLLRLARPWGHDAWPKFYSVEFRDPPRRLAVGQPFEVELLQDAQHRVPDDARIEYRYENGAAAMEQEAEPMRWINGAMVARRDNITRPFWYRAGGGDDHGMPWIHLDVVEPPRLDTCTLTLHPPDYSGLPVETSDKSVYALRGTRVELKGSATKKLKSAAVRLDGGDQWPLELAPDGYGFSLALDQEPPLVIDRTGQYWIELVDHDGLLGGVDDRWNIHAIADQAPTVTIDQPASNIFVTPQGEVVLRITAKDDLSLAQVGLHFNRSDRTDVEDFSVPMYDGPAEVEPLTGAGLLIGGNLGENRTLEHRWSLAELGLKAPVQVTFWATARDYLPQTGKSTTRRLSIITPQELEERLEQRQSLIFGELQRVLKLQQDARAQTKSLDIQLKQVGQLTKQDIDHAQSAELNQRQVKRTLTSPSEGIPAQIVDFLSDLASNKVDSPELARRMEAVLEELERLGEEHLGTVERELTSLVKAAQSKLPADDKPPAKAEPDAAVSKSLASAGEHQDQVIGSLEKMLSELGQWDNYRRFARDVAEVQRDQHEIAQATQELQPKTVGRDAKDLDAQQQADLQKLSQRQIELSRRLEKIQQQMSQMSQSVKQSDPLSAATISDGLHQAQQQAISGQMRRSAGQLEKNQLGQAAGQQARISKDLDDLMGILSNRREQELTRLVRQLRDAEQEMSRLREQQAGLRKKMRQTAEDASKSPAERKQELERLAREQKNLEEETARLARKLERLQADKAGRSAAGAAGKMGQASESGQQGDESSAEEQAQKAEKDLEDAQQQLAERRRQAEEDLAREQIARLQDSLKGLQDQQQKLIQETQRLENLRAAEGRFTRAQLSTLGDTARQQQALQNETTLLAEKLALSEVIHLALSGAAGQMTRAANLLTQRETGARTQSAQEAARLRFAQLLAALENTAKPGQGEQSEGAGGAGGGSSGGANQDLTQLKLLKILQEDLNGRYRAAVAEEQAPAAEPLAEIAAEQGKLAELALKLSQPTEANPEDTPDKLPDVRSDDAPAEVAPSDVPPPDVPLDPAAEGPGL